MSDLNLSCARDFEPEFYGDLVYRLKKIVGSNTFSMQFIKTISHFKTTGYTINVLQQTACLMVNLITVGSFAFLFNCAPGGRTSYYYDGSYLKSYQEMRWSRPYATFVAGPTGFNC